MTEKKRDVRKQVIWTFLLTILLGIPVWWKTTQVYRSHLPHDEIASWNHNITSEGPWKIDLEYVLLGENQKKLDEALSLFQSHSNSLKIGKAAKTRLSITSSVQKVSDLKSQSLQSEEQTDEFLRSKVKEEKNGKFTFFVVITDDSTSKEEKAPITIGKYRHGWTLQSLSSFNKNSIDRINKALQRFVFGITQSVDENTVVRPTTSYRLSFSLLNANPEKLSPSWDIQNAVNSYLDPFLNSISDLAKFTVDSQILHYTNLLKEPEMEKNSKGFFIPHQTLPQYLNPAEWKLDFVDTSTQPVLSFILFVPDADKMPLRIKKDGNWTSTNAFISPQWGGIHIWNDPQERRGHVHLSQKEMLPIMEIFVSQLRTLLGIGPPVLPPKTAAISFLSNPKTGISLWEKDLLFRRYLRSNRNSAASTLTSMSELVQNLTNMIVKDNIGELTGNSLHALNESQKALESLNYDLALLHSKTAVDNAEEAFFDPNMLALLYFPDEHKAAIYALPFFPLFFQLFSGIYSEYKARKAKKLKKEEEERKANGEEEEEDDEDEE